MKRVWFGLGLVGIMVVLSVTPLAEYSLIYQASKLGGKITYRQNALASLQDYISYNFSSDPDHYSRSAYGVMRSSSTQYLWSYWGWQWVLLCKTVPFPCLNDSGTIFRRAGDYREVIDMNKP